MSCEYLTSDSGFLNMATYLSNNCMLPHKPSTLVGATFPATFHGNRQSIPIYNVGFMRDDDDEKGRQRWAISFGTTIVMKASTWTGIQKSPDAPRNIKLLGNGGHLSLSPGTTYDTDFRIYTYQEEHEMQGDLVSVRVDATALFIFHTLGFGDIDAEIAEIVKNGNGNGR